VLWGVHSPFIKVPIPFTAPLGFVVWWWGVGWVEYCRPWLGALLGPEGTPVGVFLVGRSWSGASNAYPVGVGGGV
jgi:hypothetical protein